MKNFKKGLLAVMGALAIVSCGEDNTDILDTPGDGDPIGGETPDSIGFIELTRAADETVGGTFFSEVEGEAGGTVKGRVKFTAIGKSMKRLYITETLPGGEPHPFDLTLEGKAQREVEKPDGSIDLDDAKKEAFDFTFDLKVPDSVDDGAIIYNFWATSGRGDFETPSKRLLVGVGTISVKVGDGVILQDLVTKENIVLEAPTGDAKSSTFVSFFDLSRVYKINEGSEFSAFWDFGYFYGNTKKASLASTNNYPSDVFNLLTEANKNNAADDIPVVQDDLKKVYFKLNNSIDYNAITTVAELEAAGLTVSSSDAQRVTTLSEGDVVEFLDVTGRKGIIKIEKIASGFTGTITLSVKEIPAKPIMNGSNM